VRKPDTIEQLNLDFNGFFASIHQQVYPYLGGKRVGIVPFDGTKHTCVIVVSKEAKRRCCSKVLNYGNAQAKCPEIILAPHEPSLCTAERTILLLQRSMQ